ncbi:MAG: C39 family peptidase [Nocardioides sp.]|uniref:C39 family peptidase n=1 Tax=Nocardioides sp. TaxID=35761 RepID=UPI0039E331B5
MPRRRTVAIVALAMLVAAAPFLPRAHGPEDALTPTDGKAASRMPSAANAYGTVTPAMRQEIDRVVDAGLRQPKLAPATALGRLATQQVRCADFEGLTYCLDLGWTESTPEQAATEVARAARADTISAKSSARRLNTGDLDPAAELREHAALSPQRRANQERAELTEAARSVAKVWVIRHEIEGIPYPAGFLARHPEAQALLANGAADDTTSQAKSSSPSATPTKTKSPKASASPSSKPTVKTARDYPRKSKVLNPTQVAEQTRTYWCGPTSTQMIVWGWKHNRQSQQHWANELGTTSSGTAIGSIVSVINKHTGWDRADYAGPYITLDIGKYSYAKWYLLIMRHIHDYKAPIVMHPILLKKYFSYLDDDGSGHYQVGRGYDKRGKKANLVSYFEPWNQQRFDPSEPFIKRVQWHSAYQSYRANQAHPYHNIGV